MENNITKYNSNKSRSVSHNQLMSVPSFQTKKTNYFHYYPDKYRVIFLTTDLQRSSEFEGFVQLAQGVKQLGYDVTIITNNCDDTMLSNELKSIHVHKVDKQDSESVADDLCIMRTAYAALWFLNKSKDLQPTFIIVQEANAAVSILTMLGHYHVVYYQTLNELKLLSNPDPSYEKIREFHKTCMKNAVEILVQNELSLGCFNTMFEGLDFRISVIHPCYDTVDFHRCPIEKITDIVDIPEDATYFVTIGFLRPSSMFELVIHSFAFLLDKVHACDPLLYNKLYLIVACYLEDNRLYYDYMNSLEAQALALCMQIPRVKFISGAPINWRKTLMHSCEAVVLPMILDDGKLIVESAMMKKPVIAINLGVAKELIVHDQTGYLLPPNALEFCTCMFIVTYDRASIDERSRKLTEYVERHFSELRYFTEVQTLLLRNSHYAL